MSQRVFIVVGAKGGVGATTVAIKLVEELPAAAERVIVDADLAGKRSLAIWYDLSVELDVGRVIGSAATAKTAKGLLVMELARTYEDGFIQTAESVMRSISRLRASEVNGPVATIVSESSSSAGRSRVTSSRITRILGSAAIASAIRLENSTRSTASA